MDSFLAYQAFDMSKGHIECAPVCRITPELITGVGLITREEFSDKPHIHNA